MLNNRTVTQVTSELFHCCNFDSKKFSGTKILTYFLSEGYNNYNCSVILSLEINKKIFKILTKAKKSA